MLQRRLLRLVVAGTDHRVRPPPHLAHLPEHALARQLLVVPVVILDVKEPTTTAVGSVSVGRRRRGVGLLAVLHR